MSDETTFETRLAEVERKLAEAYTMLDTLDVKLKEIAGVARMLAYASNTVANGILGGK